MDALAKDAQAFAMVDMLDGRHLPDALGGEARALLAAVVGQDLDEGG